MPRIKAPFNFVPLNNQVVIPEWGPFISHDIPFEDGESGSLEVHIQAHNPIFVKDPVKKKGEVQLFNQTASGEYFIPGSSIRGMIRGIMEIMTFSKLEQMTDKRSAYRDFHNNDLYPKSDISNQAYCGWLSRGKDNTYNLVRCGKPYRVHYKNIDEFFRTGFHPFFTKNSPGFRFDPTKDEQKAARFKYKKLVEHSDSEHPELVAIRMPKQNKVDNRQMCEIKRRANEAEQLSHNEIKGKLVLTGHPSPRQEPIGQKGTGKVYDFLFEEKGNKPETLPESLFEDMKVAYLDYGKKEDQSIDWRHWKGKLKEGEAIPVFFHTVDGQQKGDVKSMGLSLLYKFAYKNSARDLVKKKQKETGIDLTQAILGYTSLEKGKEEALKGRVHIGHAFAEAGTAKPASKEVFEILSGPKPSYYPLYVKQEVNGYKINGKFQNYDSDNAEIAGRKFYPIHAGGVKHYEIPNENKEANTLSAQRPSNLGSPFLPLQKGATFKFKVSYHNLKKVELGALVSALSFHNSTETYHSLGMAKSLGYGKVKLSIDNFENYQKYLKAFEAYMSLSIQDNWSSSAPIQELISMASEQASGKRDLEYMNLSNKDFSEVKKGQEGLANYTSLPGITPKTAHSLVSSDDIEAAHKLKAKLKETYDKKRDTKAVFESLLEDRKRKFEARLAERKAELLKQLETQKGLIKEIAENKERENRIKKLKAEGIVWKSTRVNTRNPLADLKKDIKLFYQRIKKPVGLLETQHHLVFENMVIDIARNMRAKRLKEKWLLKYEDNTDFQEIAIWIGEAKSKALLKKVQQILRS